MESSSLGLFPLNVVLFPGTSLPLHVFEPRYISLITNAIETKGEFGINLVSEGRLHPVGCTARVVSVTDEFDDGRMDVIVQGISRYQLVSMDETNHLYATGTIQPLADEDDVVDAVLLRKCSELYNTVVDLVYGTAGFRLEIQDMGAESASFYMAPKSGLAIDQKQKLLAMTSENSRLEMLFSHLTEIIPSVRQAETLQRIIRCDGYLPAIEK